MRRLRLFTAGLLLLQARLPLIYRALLVLLILPAVLILRLRRLRRLKVPLGLILLHHRMLLAIVLLLCRLFPILVFREPIRMVGRYPVRVLVVPPFAIVPVVLWIVCAVFSEPA